MSIYRSPAHEAKCLVAMLPALADDLAFWSDRCPGRRDHNPEVERAVGSDPPLQCAKIEGIIAGIQFRLTELAYPKARS